MARKLRVHAPGALYHVTLRGNHQQPIFRTPADRARLDEIVVRGLERYSSRLHAYCWMTNHVHMLIQVHIEPLGKLMQCIASRYARHAQSDVDTTGHFFERRYHSVVVERDSYLLELVRYIHLNPVRGGLCVEPSHYPWSSHCVYLGTALRPWVTTAPTLRLFGTHAAAAREAYARFIASALETGSTDCPATSGPQDGDALADTTFMAHIGDVRHPARARITLEDLSLRVCLEAGVALERVRCPARSRRLSAVRADILRRAVEQGVASATEVARFLNRSLSTICRLSDRYCK